MQQRVRTIRDRYCESKSNENPRYLALSNAVAGLNKAIADIGNEQAIQSSQIRDRFVPNPARRRHGRRLTLSGSFRRVHP